MVNIIQKLFGNEDIVSSFKELDSELKRALINFRRLEDDWKAKVRLVNNYFKEWDRTGSFRDLKDIRKHIRLIEELEIEEEKEAEKESVAVLKIEGIIKRILSKLDEKDIEEIGENICNSLKDLHENLKISSSDKSILLRIIETLFNRKLSNWRKLRIVLNKQIVFYNRYIGKDTGTLHQAIPEFIRLLRIEGKIIGVDKELMGDIIAIEKIFHSNKLKYVNYNRKEKLIKWGFFYSSSPNLGDYLISHWSQVLRIRKATAPHDREMLFRESFRNCGNLIRERGLGDLVTIAEASDPEDVAVILKVGFFYVPGLIAKSGLLDVGLNLSRLARATYTGQVESMLGQGLKNLRPIINTYGLSEIVRIAESVDENDVYNIMTLGLPALFGLIRKQGLQKVGNDLIMVNNKANKRNYLILKSLSSLKKPILRFGLEIIGFDLVDLQKILESRGEGNLISDLATHEEFISRYGLRILLKPAMTLREDLLFPFFTRGFGIFRKFKASTDEFNEIMEFIYSNPDLIHYYLFPTLFAKISSKEEFYKRYEELRSAEKDTRYSTVQGLNALGFICCNVTNAYFDTDDDKPYNKITDMITNKLQRNPSVSIIKHGVESSIAVSERGDIKGSIGVIFDYGYIYQAYARDVRSTDVVGKKSGKMFRQGPKEMREKSKLVAKYSPSEYNEVLLKKYTISGIFYTKGCQKNVTNKLVAIINDMSFKRHINGAYWYRTGKEEIPEKITKVFPIYEINTKDNEVNLAYIPKKSGFKVIQDKPNNSYIAISE